MDNTSYAHRLQQWEPQQQLECADRTPSNPRARVGLEVSQPPPWLGANNLLKRELGRRICAHLRSRNTT